MNIKKLRNAVTITLGLALLSVATLACSSEPATTTTTDPTSLLETKQYEALISDEHEQPTPDHWLSQKRPLIHSGITNPNPICVEMYVHNTNSVDWFSPANGPNQRAYEKAELELLERHYPLHSLVTLQSQMNKCAELLNKYLLPTPEQMAYLKECDTLQRAVEQMPPATAEEKDVLAQCTTDLETIANYKQQ